MKRYIPKTGEQFRAFLKVECPDKEHAGSPFECIDSDHYKVDATDKNGMLCILSRHSFYFERVECVTG